MSAIEDTRKLLQDFVAPEFRELKAQIVAGKEATQLRFDAADAKIDEVDARLSAKIDHVDAKLTAQIEQVDTKLTAQIEQVDAKLTAQIDHVDAKLTAQIEQVDAKLTAQIEQVDAKLTAKLDQLDLKFMARTELILARMESQHMAVLNALSIDKRLDRLERQAKPPESNAA